MNHTWNGRVPRATLSSTILYLVPGVLPVDAIASLVWRRFLLVVLVANSVIPIIKVIIFAFAN